jgi:Tfp pilus assembly protein PilO
MRFFNTSPADQQRIAVVVPIVALAVSMFAVYPKWQDYQALGPRVEQQRKKLSELRAAALPPDIPGIAALPALPSEPPEFMGEINDIATAANCHVTGFDLKPPAGAVDTGPMQAVKAQVMLVGRYSDLRTFITLVSHAIRVFAVSDLSIAPVVRAKDDHLPADALQATIEIERYVAPAETK